MSRNGSRASVLDYPIPRTIKATPRQGWGGARAKGTQVASEDNGYRNQSKRILKEQYKDLENHIDSLRNDQRCRGWVQDEETASQDKVINNCLEAMRQITTEIERQRLEKIRKEEARKRRDDERERRGSSNGARRPDLGSALRQWIDRQEQSAPDVVNLTWALDGRQYSARYYADTQKLDVSLLVPAGTPNARQRGNRYFLPCNTPEQHEAAVQATDR